MKKGDAKESKCALLRCCGRDKQLNYLSKTKILRKVETQTETGKRDGKIVQGLNYIEIDATISL